DNDSTFDPLHLYVVPHLKPEILTDVLGDHHLSALADFPDGHDRIPLFSYMTARIHNIRLSERQKVSSSAKTLSNGRGCGPSAAAPEKKLSARVRASHASVPHGGQNAVSLR